MKRFFKWLEKNFSRLKTSIATDQPSNSSTVEPDDIANDDYRVEMPGGVDVPGGIDAHGSETDVMMPDIYADRHDATEPDLKILDQASPDVDESAGFNPYDTGVLQKKSDSKPRST